MWAAPRSIWAKKIEGREMKLSTALAIIIHPLLILAFRPSGVRPPLTGGDHKTRAFTVARTQVPYEYAPPPPTTAPGFEGLADILLEYHHRAGHVLGRHLPIVIQLAIAGSLMKKTV